MMPYAHPFVWPGPEPGSLLTFKQSPPLSGCSLCWSSIILLVLLYPLLAPLYPPVCYTLGHYHLVRLTGFGEGDCGGPTGSTPVLKAPFCIDRAAGSLCYRWNHMLLLEKRESSTISESAWINSPGWPCRKLRRTPCFPVWLIHVKPLSYVM